MTLAAYALRRIAAILVILVVLSLLVFGLLALMPGDPALTLLGPKASTPEALAAVRERFGIRASSPNTSNDSTARMTRIAAMRRNA